MCLILAFSIKQSGPFLIFSRNLYIANLLLSIFNAMIYFPIVEIVANDSGVRKSIKIAWGVFAKHFINFTIIGFILAFSMQVISTVIGVTATLIKYSFNLKALINLDFVTPYLSFPDNKFYRLASTTGGTIWNVYSITILVLAYLKYSGVKTNTT